MGIDPYLGFVPPLGLKYYTYNGTLTTPPCTTGVQWILHAVPVLIYNTTSALWKNISGAYIDNGLNASKQNARPTQAMDGRTLYVGGKTGYTVMSTAVLAGTNVLQIVDHAGFAVGDTIIIEAGTSRQESNIVSAIGSLVLTTPLHYSHPAGASVYSEGKDISKNKTDFASNAVFLGVGCLLGFAVVMIVQGARSRMRSATSARHSEATNSDCDEGESRLFSSL